MTRQILPAEAAAVVIANLQDEIMSLRVDLHDARAEVRRRSAPEAQIAALTRVHELEMAERRDADARLRAGVAKALDALERRLAKVSAVMGVR